MIVADQIYDYYEALRKNDVVSILSADGFLEAEDEELLERMADMAKQEIEVRYYYPDKPRNPSFQDFEKLVRLYQRKLPLNIVDKYIQGYQVRSSGNHLFGFRTRYVVISNWNDTHTQQRVVHVFLCTKSSQPSENDHLETKAFKAWIRLEDTNAREYFSAVCNAAEPIRNLGFYQNHLKSQIQDAYRKEFETASYLETYNKIQTTIKSTVTLHQALTPIFDLWWTAQKNEEFGYPIIRMLDIGSGDGSITNECFGILSRKIGANAAIRLTSIDSAHVSKHMMHKLLKLPSTLSITTSFEKLLIHDRRFDLILAVHSLYLMDPSYLLKMYNLLTDGGMLVVISAPYENNILSLICSTVDSLLPVADARIRKIQPYPGKIVKQDPFRNYSEDLHALAKEYFHEKAVLEFKYEQELDLSLFETKAHRLTEFSHEIVSLFSKNLLDSKYLENVETKILQKKDNITNKMKVRNDNWVFAVSKQDVRHHLGQCINGEINQQYSV